ncbi:MAG: sulfite exporter TauE/SafE family protein [Phycisphaerae bacterium]|nr:sulfite exporter TauE/SafE family protein [Phycisphaerae bacterium]
MTVWLAVVSALWLGIQTSISPCPLATNIAAVAFLGRTVSSPRRVLLSGLVYAVGRTVAYVGLSVLILWILKDRIAAGGTLSGVLQKYGMMAIGPLLIVLGMLLLNMLALPGSLSLAGVGLQERAAKGGVWWSGALGFIFAMSFCPASAALFFLLLIPLAAAQESMLVLPTLYGVGTALPVIAFAVLMVFANQYVAKTFNRLAQVERWVRILAGVVFIGAGVYYTLTVIYGIKLS